MCWSFIRGTGVFSQIFLSRSDPLLLLLQRPVIGSRPASPVATSQEVFRFFFLLDLIIGNAFLRIGLGQVFADLRLVFSKGLGRFTILVLFLVLVFILLPPLLLRTLSNRD